MVRLPTYAERSLWASPVYESLAAAGFDVRQYDDPGLGWLVTSPVGEYGPFSSPEEAVGKVLRRLVRRVLKVQRRGAAVALSAPGGDASASPLSLAVGD